jgi:hypothetical protein
MSDAAQQWLSGRASPPGMLACGLRKPGGALVCRSVEGLCPVAKMEKILAQFESLEPALPQGESAPRWTTWNFEQGQIRFVPRADGWLLGLVVRPDSAAAPKLDPLSEEFLALQFDS